MGFSTTCDVVPFKISACENVDENEDSYDDNYDKSNFPNMTEVLWNHLESFGIESDSGNLAGWNWNLEDIKEIGKNGEIVAEVFRKDDKMVYRINESEYEMVGVTDLTFVANDKESLIEFCNDVGIDPKNIEEDVDVSQTS